MPENKQVSDFFIVITGPPASGKTTLGSRIASELELPISGKSVIIG